MVDVAWTGRMKMLNPAESDSALQGQIFYRGDMKSATLVALVPYKQLLATISVDVILQNGGQLFDLIQGEPNKETVGGWNGDFLREAKANKSYTRFAFDVTILLGDNIGSLRTSLLDIETPCFMCSCLPILGGMQAIKKYHKQAIMNGLTIQ